jgi:hypothetical protein
MCIAYNTTAVKMAPMLIETGIMNWLGDAKIVVVRKDSISNAFCSEASTAENCPLLCSSITCGTELALDL